MAGNRRCYWYLRLMDADWFSTHFPHHAKPAIPSIHSDRKRIEAIIQASVSPTVPGFQRVRKCAASLRAYHRDRKWLDAKLGGLSNQSDEKAKRLRGDVEHERILALQRALEEVLREEGRPARIFAKTLGAKVGLSHSQVGDAIRSHKPLAGSLSFCVVDTHRCAG